MRASFALVVFPARSKYKYVSSLLVRIKLRVAPERFFPRPARVLARVLDPTPPAPLERPRAAPMLVLAAPRALATPPSPRRGASSWRRGAPRLPPSAGTNDARGEPRPPREQPRSARRPVRPPLLSRRAPGGGAVRARASADERGDDREDDEDDEPVVVVHGVEYAVDDDPDIFAAEAEAEKKIK